MKFMDYLRTELYLMKTDAERARWNRDGKRKYGPPGFFRGLFGKTPDLTQELYPNPEDR
jgi:hypothetical protein